MPRSNEMRKLISHNILLLQRIGGVLGFLSNGYLSLDLRAKPRITVRTPDAFGPISVPGQASCRPLH